MSDKVRVLTVSALALSLLLTSAETAADEASDMGSVERERATEAESLAADIEAVERELAAEAAAEARALAAEAKALALYERAKERAERAVQASSLGQEFKKYTRELEEAWTKYINASNRAKEAWSREREAWDRVHEADRDAVLKDTGKPGVTFDERMKAYDEWRETDQTRPRAEALTEEAKLLTEEAKSLKQEYQRMLTNPPHQQKLGERMDHLVRKMTAKFLKEEVDKAAEQEFDELERELRDIHGKVQQGLVI